MEVSYVQILGKCLRHVNVLGGLIYYVLFEWSWYLIPVLFIVIKEDTLSLWFLKSGIVFFVFCLLFSLFVLHKLVKHLQRNSGEWDQLRKLTISESKKYIDNF